MLKWLKEDYYFSGFRFTQVDVFFLLLQGIALFLAICIVCILIPVYNNYFFYVFIFVLFLLNAGGYFVLRLVGKLVKRKWWAQVLLVYSLTTAGFLFFIGIY
ncbi:MAG: hypothetical protein R2794_12925 [Chitinophagales bacterium]